ncbi:MAG TPA: alanine--glyoxylate aminotransferase family protein [Methanomassiliicoccales archaeon]|nr:alanine--glyoxylate aminotransferase family protein [Methanomassiliicoccales archaeon]
MSNRLFTVGPVEVFPDTLQAMSKPMIIHRGEDYKRLQRGIVEKLHRVLDTDLNIMLAPASATAFLEACVRCGVNERMMSLSNGSFGDRWASIGTACMKQVKKLDFPWGKGIRCLDLADKMEPGIEAVTFISNESSTGVLNPTHEIVKTLRAEYDPLVFVDGVTSVGAVDFKLRQLPIDALVFGSQKALALPPGLAIICASDRLLKKAETVKDRGYYLDLVEYKKFADKDLPLTTPPVSLMYGLDYQLDKMLKEGMANRYARHHEMAEAVRSWALKRFSLYAEDKYRSETITVVQSGSLPFDVFDKKLKQKGFEVSPGYGKIKDSTFRIGHMGDLTMKDIHDLTNAIDSVLEEMK